MALSNQIKSKSNHLFSQANTKALTKWVMKELEQRHKGLQEPLTWTPPPKKRKKKNIQIRQHNKTKLKHNFDRRKRETGERKRLAWLWMSLSVRSFNVLLMLSRSSLSSLTSVWTLSIPVSISPSLYIRQPTHNDSDNSLQCKLINYTNCKMKRHFFAQVNISW